MGLHKITKIIGLILSIVGAAYLGYIIMNGDNVIKETGTGIDGFLYTAYIILVIVLVAVALFGIKGLLSGNIKTTLMTLGAFIVVVGVSYGLANGNEMSLTDGGRLSESNSRWIGAGLYTFYILAFVAIGAMIISGFKKTK